MRTRKFFFLISFILILLLNITYVYAADLYWENPRTIAGENGRYPQAETDDEKIYLFYQEIEYVNESEGNFYISLQYSNDGISWDRNERIFGPLPFSGKPAPIYDIAIDSAGVLHVTCLVSESETVIISSTDRGKTFTETARFKSEETNLTPVLSPKSNGGMILFLAREREDSISNYYSVYEGEEWSEFKLLEEDENLIYNFTPHHTSYRDKEYVVFQVFQLGEMGRHLYVKTSDDGGLTWSDAKILTDFAEVGTVADEYINQRPYIRTVNNKLLLIWERQYRRFGSSVYLAELKESGDIAGDSEIVTSDRYSANTPKIIHHQNTTRVLWFDSRISLETVYLSTPGEVTWSAEPLSRRRYSSRFPVHAVFKGRLYFFWQELEDDRSSIAFLEPDTTADPPRIISTNFAAGKRSPIDRPAFRWIPPEDPSGVAAYSYVWSRNPNEEIPKDTLVPAGQLQRRFTATDDGYWYLRVAALDGAGNWSPPATAQFFRDTTPPTPVEFVPPELDENGFMISNTFNIRWNPPEDENVAGYSYSFEYLGSEQQFITAETVSRTPPSETLTEETEYFRKNIENGLWALSVVPIDRVGNIGSPTTIFLRFNKYIPFTTITSLEAPKNDLGNINLRIIGKGFTANGTINELILDQDKKQPYDYIFKRRNGAFSVISDRRITGPTIDTILEGEYYVGLYHPERGLYFTSQQLALRSTGTMLFGDFTIRYAPAWEFPTPSLFSFSGGSLVMWLSMALFSMVIVFSSFRIGSLTKEGILLRREVHAFLAGDRKQLESGKEELRKMKKRGIGLRIKFTIFIIILIISVVLLVSIPLGYYMLGVQQTNLAESLIERVEIMLRTLTIGARENLPSAENNILDLDSLVNQTDAMDITTYATITGQGRDDTASYNYIWATNDPNILATFENPGSSDKINTDQLILGVSQIQDKVSPEIEELSENLNARARAEISEDAANLTQLDERTLELVTQEGEEVDRELQQIDEAMQELRERIQKALLRIGDVRRSEPEFSQENLIDGPTNYLFYKPVMYRRSGSDIYYRGTVRLGVSTDTLVQEIMESRNTLIFRTGIFTVIAMLLGILGALILASIIVIPIKRLVRGVEIIRDTEDKGKLEEHVIKVKTRDELSVLANTINQMTQGLVQAAAASKDLTMGKEVQKMFIPLEKDKAGRKLTTGREVNQNIEFFGYYEGAKGVSGDYFDYLKLDNSNYAFIKCDVSGKGVPAALIMVEVATIFLNHFREWKFEKNSIQLSKVVYRINDLLEERGFKGRFAALTVGFVDVNTGVSYMCNAGDNLVIMFHSKNKHVEEHFLPEAPAAGVFPSMMVETQSGFQQVKLTLAKEDIMFLFSDGIPESKRTIRDNNFIPTTITEETYGGKLPEDVLDGSEEEFGMQRVKDVLEAVMNQGTYTLKKVNAEIEGDLVFDYSECNGTAEEATLALMAVEKIFRMYPDTSSGREVVVSIDRKIDQFLKKHFNQRDLYCHHPVASGEESEYVNYSHVKEEEQYDDLTILTIRKK